MPIDQRLERTFNHLDHDGDGAITSADFEQAARAVAQGFELDPSSDKARKLKEGYARAWQLLRQQADVDADGRITLEEFGQATRNLASDRSFADNIAAVSEAEFAAADSDNDGELSRAEFSRLIRAFGHVEGDIDQAFARLDKDGDGRVTRAEYTAAWQECLATGDPNAVGGQVLAQL